MGRSIALFIIHSKRYPRRTPRGMFTSHFCMTGVVFFELQTIILSPCRPNLCLWICKEYPQALLHELWLGDIAPRIKMALLWLGRALLDCQCFVGFPFFDFW